MVSSFFLALTGNIVYKWFPSVFRVFPFKFYFPLCEHSNKQQKGYWRNINETDNQVSPVSECLNIFWSPALISDDDDEVKDREAKQEYNLLCDWIKQQLGDKVAKVQVSKRLSSSPCVLVSGKFGWSANMERSVGYYF